MTTAFNRMILSIPLNDGIVANRAGGNGMAVGVRNSVGRIQGFAGRGSGGSPR